MRYKTRMGKGLSSGSRAFGMAGWHCQVDCRLWIGHHLVIEGNWGYALDLFNADFIGASSSGIRQRIGINWKNHMISYPYSARKWLNVQCRT
jgi:hypothetical protein